MRVTQRPGSGQPGIGRRLVRWARETNHDDIVPTLLQGSIALAAILVLFTTVMPPWMAISLLLSPVATAVVLRARRQIQNARRTIERRGRLDYARVEERFDRLPTPLDYAHPIDERIQAR